MHGKVRIEVFGVNINKFYKILKNNNICMENIERKDYKTLLFTTLSTNMKKLIAITSNSCYNIRVISHFGIAKITHFFKKHLGYLIGIILFLFVAIISNFYVSDIRIYGLTTINENQICFILSQNGIKVGGLIKGIENEKISSIISNEFKEISLISVMKKGTTIIINIKEKQSIDFDKLSNQSE